MTLSKDQLDALYDATVIDSDGDKVGSIAQLYLDDETDQPTFATVRTGLFGTKETFVPLQEVDFSGDELRVPFDKATIKDAPRIDPEGHLGEAEQQELYRYYQLEAPGSAGDGRPQDTDGRDTGRDTNARDTNARNTVGPDADDRTDVRDSEGTRSDNRHADGDGTAAVRTDNDRGTADPDTGAGGPGSNVTTAVGGAAVGGTAGAGIAAGAVQGFDDSAASDGPAGRTSDSEVRTVDGTSSGTQDPSHSTGATDLSDSAGSDSDPYGTDNTQTTGAAESSAGAAGTGGPGEGAVGSRESVHGSDYGAISDEPTGADQGTSEVSSADPAAKEAQHADLGSSSQDEGQFGGGERHGVAAGAGTAGAAGAAASGLAASDHDESGDTTDYPYGRPTSPNDGGDDPAVAAREGRDDAGTGSSDAGEGTTGSGRLRLRRRVVTEVLDENGNVVEAEPEVELDDEIKIN